MVDVLHDQVLGPQSLGHTPAVGVVPREFSNVEEAHREQLAYLVVRDIVAVPRGTPDLVQAHVRRFAASAKTAALGVVVENTNQSLHEVKVSPGSFHAFGVGLEKVRGVEHVVPPQNPGLDLDLVNLPVGELFGAAGQKSVQKIQIFLQVLVVPAPQSDSFERLGDAAANHFSHKICTAVVIVAVVVVVAVVVDSFVERPQQRQQQQLCVRSNGLAVHQSMDGRLLPLLWFFFVFFYRIKQ
mmetsp:Transcript_27834/g.58336  ORF Transcript_27834/g.58336 Transcript_27834/m.58336 type:complete len:241 (-) Transcript_27834:333-1055(-)